MTVEKKNIFLTDTIKPYGYTGQGHPGSENRIPIRSNCADHATFLQNKISTAFSKSLTEKQVAAIKSKNGTYLEFIGQENYDLITKSLEDIRSKIRLLNIKTDNNNAIHATVYIPNGKESYFLKKIDDYNEIKTKKGNPKNKDLINSIENVRLAVLENSFWFGMNSDIPYEHAAWCEAWLRYENDIEDNIAIVNHEFEEVCKCLEIEYKIDYINFPERIVRLILADAAQLSKLIANFDYIAEFRRSPETSNYFDSLEPNEQSEWVDDLLSRLEFSFGSATVCLLDSGLNSGHKLLMPAVDEDACNSIDPKWGSDDNTKRYKGHGTEMAGIALYNDLKNKLVSKDKFTITHKIESVKLLPPHGENEPELYGSKTQQAVYIAEIAHPEKDRTICMAITSEKYTKGDGSPSSWSGAIDSLTSGTGLDKKHRLMFISGGNVYPQSGYPDINKNSSVQNPGQAWNAITVGAYCNDIEITEPLLSGYHPVADIGELSPYSSSSLMWDIKWPIKPEILCDGGNVATDGTDYTECADFSLLTVNSKPTSRSFSTIFGTSSATAQAAWIAAQIMNEYPGLWPETVRALIIHSSQWTQKMIQQFCLPDRKSSGRRQLLRMCGYGIPSLERAIQCMNNNVNMIIQGELQPFKKNEMNEMHLHKIPWPKDVLLSLGEIPVKLHVTLSYFIEPGPGEIGWKDKYRYPSCNLRFAVINKNQDQSDFLKRVNAQMRGDDKTDSGEGTSGSDRWYLGEKNRDVGSIHSDFTENQTAADLCECNLIAVYPVIGWWRERAYLKKYNSKIRYSMIVSLSTPETEVDLYTPIINQIQTKAKVEVEIKSIK